MAETADVVVIGAGALGSAIALELARSSYDVLVVDRYGGPGSGSTSASSSIVRFNYSTDAGVTTSWESKQCWEDWSGHLGCIDPAGLASYRRTGGLVLDPPDASTLRVQQLFRAVGVQHEVLDADELARSFPYLDVSRFGPPRRIDDPAFWADAHGAVTGLFTSEGGYVDDPALAAHNLLHAAVERGCRVRFHAIVVEVLRDDNKVIGIKLADGSSAHAPIVINVGGPHSSQINALAGVLADFAVTTRALRQEVFAIAGSVAYADTPGPFVADLDLGVYFRPAPGGDVLVGGLEAACDPLVWVDDPDAVDVRPSAGLHELYATRLARRMPEVRVPGRPRGIVGLYDVTDDWIPIYDRTSLDGFYVAIGTSGNQFKNAPVVGQLMHSLIESCAAGHDHDRTPVLWRAPRTGRDVDLRHYSRLREANPQSSNTVLG